MIIYFVFEQFIWNGFQKKIMIEPPLYKSYLKLWMLASLASVPRSLVKLAWLLTRYPRRSVGT